MNAEQLLKFDLGFPGLQAKQLNMAINIDLLAAISTRAGVASTDLAKTMFSTTVPFLFQSGNFDAGDFDYCSVLDAPSEYAQRSLASWMPWLRREGRNKVTACRLCLSDYPNSPIMLSWGLRIMSSCPIHGLLLEQARLDGQSIHWINDRTEAVSHLVSELDSRTQEALTEGLVQLPGGTVSAIQWFRLMRTIFRELNTIAFGRTKSYSPVKLWNAADYSPNTFDRQFVFDKSCALLISIAIDLIERGKIWPAGEYGYLFQGALKTYSVL